MTETRLSPGTTAPTFTLPDADGVPIGLESYRGKRVVVYFYPAAMTRGCTTQACDFRDSLDSLRAAGVEVLGISPDAPTKLAEFREHDALTFPLLSDENLDVHKAYGAYGERDRNGVISLGVIRSTFVLDPAGLVETAEYNVQATGHVAQLRRELGVDD